MADASCSRTATTLTIEGRCLSLTSLSDFIGNLEASRYFMRPVEIVESEVVAATARSPTRFSSPSGTFQMAGVDCRGAGRQAGQAGAARGGPRG